MFSELFKVGFNDALEKLAIRISFHRVGKGKKNLLSKAERQAIRNQRRVASGASPAAKEVKTYKYEGPKAEAPKVQKKKKRTMKSMLDDLEKRYGSQIDYV
jgi:hypothetical protein